MEALALDQLAEINYWAVAVAALVTFFLGGLWYSPALFEGVWMSANGYQADEVRQMQTDLGVVGFAGALLAYLAMASVFAVLSKALGISGVAGGLLLGLLIWLGFVASSGLTVNLFSLRPLASWFIDAGFQLVFLLTTGAIIGLWR